MRSSTPGAPVIPNGHSEPPSVFEPMVPPNAAAAGSASTPAVASSSSFARASTLPPAAQVRLQSLETLAAISNAMNATADETEIGQLLARHTAELLGVPGVLVQQVNDHRWLQAVAAGGLSPEFVAAQCGPLEGSVAARALTEKRIYATWNLAGNADRRQAEAAQQEGIRSVACAPMFFAGRPVGALSVYCSDLRRFTDEDFHVLSLLAAQGGIALTNAGSYRAMRARTEEMHEGFRRIGEALSASLDLSETLYLIVQLAGEMTRADAGAVFLYHDSNNEESGLPQNRGDDLRLAGMANLDRRSVRRFRTGALSPIARRALTEHRAVIVPDTRRVPDVPFPAIKPGEDPAKSSVSSDVIETRSVLCIPLLIGDRSLGVLEEYAATPGAFQQEEADLLTAFAHQASVAIARAQVFAQECYIAETLQRSFLPDLPPHIDGYEIGRIYAAGNAEVAVGGDTYDLFPLPDGRVVAVIADVTGNGTVAATLAVMVKYTVRAYALEKPDPSSVLARLNEAARHQTDDGTFVTLCCALIDAKKGTVRVATAAHPPVLLYRAGEDSCEPACGEPGIFVGFLPGQEYAGVTLHPQAGDVLVFYTDGVTEARRDKEQFGMERLAATVRENAMLSAQEIAAAIYGAVSNHVRGERTDDIALLVLKASG